jgi:hypothetical protein
MDYSKPRRLVFKFAQHSFASPPKDLHLKSSPSNKEKHFKVHNPRVQTPSIDIKINILTEDSPQKELPTLNPAFLTAFPCENTSFTSASSGSHLNTPSLSTSGDKGLKREAGQPARYLSKVECDQIIKSKNRRPFWKKTQKQDSIKKMMTNDKNHLKDELLFRKFRKHKYIKLLPFKFEDSWEWSSHGSISPQNKARMSTRWEINNT